MRLDIQSFPAKLAVVVLITAALDLTYVAAFPILSNRLPFTAKTTVADYYSYVLAPPLAAAEIVANPRTHPSWLHLPPYSITHVRLTSKDEFQYDLLYNGRTFAGLGKMIRMNVQDRIDINLSIVLEEGAPVKRFMLFVRFRPVNNISLSSSAFGVPARQRPFFSAQNQAKMLIRAMKDNNEQLNRLLAQKSENK